jgi:hypothetical protein
MVANIAPTASKQQRRRSCRWGKGLAVLGLALLAGGSAAIAALRVRATREPGPAWRRDALIIPANSARGRQLMDGQSDDAGSRHQPVGAQLDDDGRMAGHVQLPAAPQPASSSHVKAGAVRGAGRAKVKGKKRAAPKSLDKLRNGGALVRPPTDMRQHSSAFAAPAGDGNSSITTAGNATLLARPLGRPMSESAGLRAIARFLVAWQLVNVTAAAEADNAAASTSNASEAGPVGRAFPLLPRPAWLTTVRRLAALADSSPSLRWRIGVPHLSAAARGCEVGVKIIHNCVYIDAAASRLPRPAKNTFLPALLSLLRGALSVSRQTRLPDVSFAVYSPDRTTEDPRCAGRSGVWGYSRRPADHGAFLLPWLSWESRLMEPAVAEIQAAARASPYLLRKRAGVWRGSTTGIRGSQATRSSWHSLPRSRLVLMSKMYPALLDARFTAPYGQTPPAVTSAIKAANLGWAATLPLAEQAARYRHLPDVEGNSFSDRLRLLLHANATVLKQEYEWLDFFTPALTPGEHYLPVAADMSDLVAQLRWANEHELEAAAVAARGADFASRFLHTSLAHWYTWELLAGYAQLLQPDVLASLRNPAQDDALVGCVP